MSEAVVSTSGPAVSHTTETATVARPASLAKPLQLVTSNPESQSITFAAPPAVLAEETAWRTISVKPATASLVTIIRQPSEEQLRAAGRAFIAEFEREFGPIPEEILAEVRRKWNG